MFQISLPTFPTVIETGTVAPWTIAVGGVGTVYVAERTATGAAKTGVASRRQVRRVAGRVRRPRCT
jgi:hypothetical protein